MIPMPRSSATSIWLGEGSQGVRASERTWWKTRGKKRHSKTGYGMVRWHRYLDRYCTKSAAEKQKLHHVLHVAFEYAFTVSRNTHNIDNIVFPPT